MYQQNYLMKLHQKYAGSNVGGYTRIVKAGPRRGDGAEVAVLQLI